VLLAEAFVKGKFRSAVTCQRANGALLPVDATFIRDVYEKSSVVIVSFHDLTEIKAAIREATNAAEMANMYLSSSPLAMELFNDECAIIDCNSQALDLLDFPDKTEYMKRITYKAPEYLYHGIYTRGNDEEYYRTALRDGYVRYEWVFRKKNGTKIPCEITRVRILRPDRIFVVSYIHDLSTVKAMADGLKKAEAVEKKNLAKNQFLAQISHVLRSPMNSILNIAKIQLQKNESRTREEADEAFIQIQHSSTILLGIIDDICKKSN